MVVLTEISGEDILNDTDYSECMRERTLLKIALISSLAGLLLLFLIAEQMPVSQSMVGTADTEELIVRGEVLAVTQSEESTFIRMRSSEAVPVSLLGKPLFTLQKGDRIEVRGTLEEFNGRKSVLAEEVRVI